MSKNVYNPPEAELNITKQTNARLWNPDAAGAWSLIFTPIFGSILVYKNWKALGEVEQANKSKVWIYISIIMAIISVIFTIVGLIYICTWYFLSQKKQTNYLKTNFDGKYQKKGWLKPISISIGVSAGVMAVIFGLIFILFSR
ncbi:MAG: hypothetical protein HRU38_21830 [Saccharospirillaceae bacterium]|nr:hypothetical protein [Pseudomonadales bacterium]NRB81271.1 hypothetical protein [Saccharospirillaceae bacterium]